MKQVPCWGPPNIRCPHVKLSTPCDLEPEIMCLWYIREITEKLFYTGAINWSYMQTHCCIPKPWWVVGEGVWGFIVDTIILLRTGYRRLQRFLLGLTQVPYLRRLLSRECTKKKKVRIHTCSDLVKLAESCPNWVLWRLKPLQYVAI
jgi:hypothetical protein